MKRLRKRSPKVRKASKKVRKILDASGLDKQDKVSVLREASQELVDSRGPSLSVVNNGFTAYSTLPRELDPANFTMDSTLHGKDAQKDFEEEAGKLTEEHKKIATRLYRAFKKLGFKPKPANLGDFLKGAMSLAELLRQCPTPVALAFLESLFYQYHLDHSVEILDQWRNDNFARVAVGHKLAAALILTDVPKDLEVKAPWRTWFIEAPDHLFRFSISLEEFKQESRKPPAADGTKNLTLKAAGEGDQEVYIKGFFCEDAFPVRMIMSIRHGVFIMNTSDIHERADSPLRTSVMNFIRGTCLSFEKKEHIKESGWGQKISGSNRDTGAPSDRGRRYVLSKPISIDLRQAAEEHIHGSRSGRRSVPSVQWYVRGHWRNQACGPGMRDRRPTWIEPYWKGDPEAGILVRGYAIKEKEK